MDIANRWADSEDAVRARSNDEDADGRYPGNQGRKHDRRGKRKMRGYEDQDRVDMVVVGYAEKRDNSNRGSGYVSK